MSLLRALACLLAVASVGVFAGSASSDVAAPTGLHAFLLRADEQSRTSFSRTPSFAWNPVPGADRYEFQLSLSDAFRDNAVVYADSKALNPVEAPPVALPWISGDPHSLYARVRAIVNGTATPWSAGYGFDMAPPPPPAPLPSYPGLLRWSPVEGAVKYEIWFVDANNKHVFTTTNVLDEREFYAFHQTQNWMGSVRWRIRAWRADPTPDHGINNLPATPYGAWSPVYNSTNPAYSGGPIKLLGTVSDVFSDGSPKSPAHRLMPAFLWSGNQTGSGKAAELYRVYVFSDRACLNPVYASPAVASPAYAPRPFGSIAMPLSDVAIAGARNAYLSNGAEPPAKTFAGDDVTVNEFGAPAAPTTSVPGAPGDTAAAATSGGTPVTFPDLVGAPIDLWDTDWPQAGYYWTVIPVAVQAPDQLATAVTVPAPAGSASVPVASTQGFRVGDFVTIGVAPNLETVAILGIGSGALTVATKTTVAHFPGDPVVRSTGTFEYRDLEMAQDVCASGRVARFGKDSEPSLTAANDLFATGLSSTGRLTSALHTTQFYGQPLVSWTPALGAWDYEIQWSKTNKPFAPLDSRMTKSTSYVLPLSAGVWYYRVRGFDFSLPAGSQQMSWSTPAKLVVAKPTFKIVRTKGAQPSKPAAPKKKPAAAGTKHIVGNGIAFDVPTTWTLGKTGGVADYESPDKQALVTVLLVGKSSAAETAAIVANYKKDGVTAAVREVTIPAGKAKLVTATTTLKGKSEQDLVYVVAAGAGSRVVVFSANARAYARYLGVFGRIIGSFKVV